MIIPSIDLLDGKAVQLIQGKKKVVERNDVLNLARKFNRYGEIAVIDLDAAFGKGSNTAIIEEICKIADCRVGGGIRTLEKANEILSLGATKIIIGTKASPEFLTQLPKDRVIVAVDSKKGNVVNNGWTNDTGIPTLKKIVELDEFCDEFLFTDIEQEGMLDGINKDLIESIINSSENKFTIAGGISSIEDVIYLNNLGVNQQIGMALYSSKFSLQDAFLSTLNFEKYNGYIPTVVQDEVGQVLMVASSTEESLRKSFDKELGTYFSRSRGELWTKGKTSGHIQKLKKVRTDCDNDALVFTVNQIDVACHLGSYSCFGDKKFSLYDLYDVIKSKVGSYQEGSYTSKISKNEERIKSKIEEELKELINYKNRKNLIWEIADLTYFVLILMAKNNIQLDEVINELRRRRK